MTLIKIFQFGQIESSSNFLKKNINLIISYFLVHLAQNVLVILWGFLVVVIAVESSSQQSLTVTNMNESKDIFMEMKD